MATLSEAQVFGSPQAPPAPPKTFSDAEVFPGREAPWPVLDDYGRQVDVPPPPLRSPYPTPATPPVKTPWTEDNPAFAAGDPREALPPSNVDWKKVGGAVREGWNGPVSLLPPGSDDAGQERLYGPYVGGAINTLFRSPLGLPNAVLYGAAEFANQVTGDPRAGRDVMRLAEMLPMHGGLGGPRVFAEPPVAPRVAPLMESFNRMDAARAAETPRPDTVWPLRINDEPPSGSSQAPAAAPSEPPTAPSAPPGATPAPEPAPAPPTGRAETPTEPPPTTPPPIPEAPGPQSGGAAATAPNAIPPKTPTQALNDFATSVQQTAKDRASPGVKPNTLEDHNVYVDGVIRPYSARVFDPETAGNHDVMRDIDKPYEAASNAQEQGIHDVLKARIEGIAGTDNTVGALKEQRQAVSPDALGVFKDERPVSAQPILDLINEIRDSPTGKVEAVTNTLNRIEKSLYDKNGDLEVKPSVIYGARRNLTTIRDSKALTNEASDAATARRELGQVQEVMDQVIGEGSNGYKDVYLPQWAHYSRLIDQQEYLQSKMIGGGKVTGQDGNLTWRGMQNMLEQVLADKRKPGNSRAKTLTEDQLNNMVAVRNELAALKYRNDLAKSSGSPTVKKAAAAAAVGRPVLNMAKEAAIQTVLGKTTLGAGNLIYSLGIKPGMERRAAAKGAERSEAVLSSMRNKLLSTDLPHE